MIAAASALATGCGKSLPEQPVQVRGKVLNADGTPLAERVIALHPQEASNKNNSPSGLVDKEGAFSLSCLRGRYKVTLRPIPHKGGGGAGPGPKVKNQDSSPMAKYESPLSTPLEVTIPEGGKDDLLLKLE